MNAIWDRSPNRKGDLMNREFNFGSVLKVTKEDTLADIEQNFILMKECGHNTCVIWPAAFWWEEKTELYPFATGVKILELAEKVGLNIVMELAGQLTVWEAIPDFQMKNEYLPVDENGNTLYGQSSYGYLNYFHPEVDAMILSHFKKAAAAYKNSKALIGYDVFNETMFTSFDDCTMQKFREWLKEKYGTLENLNRVWERNYGSWEQVRPTKWKWMSIMPEADYAMFHKDSIGMFLSRWCAAVKEADPEHFVIADNIHSQVSPASFYDRPQNDFGLYEAVGKIGMSFYPKQFSSTMSDALRNEVFDGYYTASKRHGFWISEMQTHDQAIFNPTTCVSPKELRRWCLEGYSSGADGLIFWMWRPFTSGLQVGSRGIVDYKGRKTERFETARELSKELCELGPLRPIRKDIGILYDPLCEDLQRVITMSYKAEQNLYLSCVFGAYAALFDKNIPCDIITKDEIKYYKTVIAPNYLVLTKEMKSSFSEYVAGGGTLILDGKFGMIDEEGRLRSEVFASDLTGIDWKDTDYRDLSFSLSGKEISGYYGKEIVTALPGTEVLASFRTGTPAFVRHTFGKGQVLSFFSYIWYGYAKNHDENGLAVLDDLSELCGFSGTETDTKLKIKLCETGDRIAVFLFNYTDETQNGTVSFDYEGESYTLPVEVSP